MKKLPLLLIAVLIAMPTLAFAKGGHKGAGHHDDRYSLEDVYFGKVFVLFQNKADLGLTDEQLEQIKKIKFDVKRALIDSEAKADLAMLDVYQELHSDQPNVEKINSALDQKFAVKANRTKNLVQSILNTKAILTPDQQAKLKELYYKS